MGGLRLSAKRTARVHRPATLQYGETRFHNGVFELWDAQTKPAGMVWEMERLVWRAYDAVVPIVPSDTLVVWQFGSLPWPRLGTSSSDGSVPIHVVGFAERVLLNSRSDASGKTCAVQVSLGLDPGHWIAWWYRVWQS